MEGKVGPVAQVVSHGVLYYLYYTCIWSAIFSSSIFLIVLLALYNALAALFLIPLLFIWVSIAFIESRNILYTCKCLNAICVGLLFVAFVTMYFVDYNNRNTCFKSGCLRTPEYDVIYNPNGIFPTSRGKVSFRDRLIMCPRRDCRWAEITSQAIQGYGADEFNRPNRSDPLPSGGLATDVASDYPLFRGLTHGLFLGTTVTDTRLCPGSRSGQSYAVCPVCPSSDVNYAHCVPSTASAWMCFMCPTDTANLTVIYVLLAIPTVLGIFILLLS